MASQPPPQGPQPGQNPFAHQPGGRPTPEQIAQMQQQLAIDAEKNGMTVPEFVEALKRQAMAQQQAAMQQQQMAQQGGHQHHDHDHEQEQQQGQPQPIMPGPPKPEALALAKFLRGQDLKPRTCLLNDQRKDMFKGM